MNDVINMYHFFQFLLLKASIKMNSSFRA